MRLVNFVKEYKRNNGSLNRYLAIRSNPNPNHFSYYFRNLQPLNALFKDIYKESFLEKSIFESRFLTLLPDCLNHLFIDNQMTDQDISKQMKQYYQNSI